jgi:hypothetical protein
VTGCRAADASQCCDVTIRTLAALLEQESASSSQLTVSVSTMVEWNPQ